METAIQARLPRYFARLILSISLIVMMIGRSSSSWADGLTATDGPKGGQMLTGSVAGRTSGAALKAGLRALRGRFDASPKLLGAVHGVQSDVTIVLFRAARRGTPISGLAIATCDSVGHARFAALFDQSRHFSGSLPSMVARFKQETQDALEQDRPAGRAASGPDFAGYEAAARHVALTRASFQDGTATIGIADGFRPVTMQGGQFSATAADGAYENLYIPIGLLDPRGSNYQMELRMSGGQPPQIPGQTVVLYNTDPVLVWKRLLAERAREGGYPDPSPTILNSKPLPEGGSGFIGKMVAGTMTLHGEPYVFSGRLLVSPPPSAEGSWLLQITIRGAPLRHAETDMPALIAMQNSERIDMEAVRNQTMRNIAAINASCSQWLAANKAAGDAARDRVFESSMRQAATAQDSIDRSTAGFIHYINSDAVIEHDPTGAHGTVDANFADALTKSDPEHFHVVPVSQYVRGVDY